MSTNYISSTELKNKVADVLNDVRYKGSTTIVKRHGKAIAKIVPIEDNTRTGKKNFMKLAGAWKDIDADKMIKNIYDARKDGSRKRKFLGGW